MAATLAIAAGKPLRYYAKSTWTSGVPSAKEGSTRGGGLPKSLDPDWLDSPSFQYEFDKWLAQVRSYKHVFLGYSSQANEVGANLCKYLAEKLGKSLVEVCAMIAWLNGILTQPIAPLHGAGRTSCDQRLPA